MNSKPEENLSLAEIKEALEEGVNFGNTLAVNGEWVGPVFEITYEVRSRFNWEEATFVVGFHLITLDSKSDPIAYQGPDND